MFSFHDFKAKIKEDGLSRQNRFYVTIAMPNLVGSAARILGSTGSAPLRDLHLLCKSVSIPGVNVATSPVRTTGEVFESPYDRNFAPATFTFYVDRKMIVRQFFDDWVNTVQNPQTRELGWYDGFKSSEISVYVVDRTASESYQITLYDAVIKSVGSLSMDNADSGVMILDATIDYRYYTTRLFASDDQRADASSVARNPTNLFDDSLGVFGFNLTNFADDFNGFQQAGSASSKPSFTGFKSMMSGFNADF
jgi:hypothetical protein